jgi:CMP-N-acetylneuraminic acid synthetase
MTGKEIVALVPMRHHSQRVQGKNYRMMAGKPLYTYILDTLIQVDAITSIVVDTDSPNLMEGIQRDYPSIKLIERPFHLRADDVPMNEILMHDCSQFPADFYLQTHSTNPLLKPQTVVRAINGLLDRYPGFDSLFSVTRRQVRIWDELSRPINHNPGILLQTQALPPFFEENSCIYIFTESSLIQRRNRIGERPMMFEISPDEAWDIDNEVDFSIVEMMMSSSIKTNPG